MYRFAVTVDSDASVKLGVREEQPREHIVRLFDAGPDVIAHYLRAQQVSPEIQAALQKVVDLRAQLDKTAARRQRLDQRIADITQEQTRIRRNMEQLARNADLYTRYVSKLDQQENEIEALRQEIAGLEAKQEQQRQALQDYLLGLDMG